MSIHNKIFFYNDNNVWAPVPDWFNFFINSGYYFSEHTEERRKSVMCISAPAAYFLPTLLGIGVIAGIIESIPYDRLLFNHFSALTQLHEGTLVRFRDGGRQKIATFLGTEIIYGEKRLKIQTQNPEAGGLVDFIPQSRAFDISISNNQQLQIPNNQVGRTEAIESQFLAALFDNAGNTPMFRFSDPKICFVGNKEALLAETNDYQFATLTESRYISGCLNEILKIRQFLGTTDIYQSEVVASQSRKIDVVLQPATVIIYCNAVSYLSCHHNFHDYDSIVLLDRSETQYQLAVDELNNRFLENNDFLNVTRPELSKLPKGIEILYWKEKR
ncbi:hypothetical protein HNR77_003258 [Paenibacillus sp. JGP012]|uniref:hypothetical protein n=1 Tax=Paenibacillus sp. JGP012 TaxID=2735914 RepID=UPI001609D8CF|nr:hypothetical protein [Paenibacillus sp. JGP012]MBB6022162.1 hypothetical protein [Paenibacillus sp. JGP012]